jgi:hypothetical protein
MFFSTSFHKEDLNPATTLLARGCVFFAHAQPQAGSANGRSSPPGPLANLRASWGQRTFIENPKDLIGLSRDVADKATPLASPLMQAVGEMERVCSERDRE